MRILPTSLTAGMTGVVGWLTAVLERFNLSSRTEFNVLDAEYGADPTGVLDSAPAFNDAYLDAKAVAGGAVIVPPGEYRIESDVVCDSEFVSLLMAGSSCTILQMVGTAKLIIRPAVMTITQGPKISGFTLRGDPAFPPGAMGIYSGDIIGAEWDDIVIEGFAGVGSIGLQLRNQTHWTELNRFRRIRVNDCTVGIMCAVDAGAVSNSFARQTWEVHFVLPRDNQVGFQATDNALLYGQHGYFDGNAEGDNAVFVDLTATSAMSGKLDMDVEAQGGAVGVKGVRENSPGFQFLCQGVRNYAGTMALDIGGAGDVLNLPYGLRIREGAVNPRMGVSTLVGGTDFVGTEAAEDASEGQRIFLTRQLGGGVRGELEIAERTAGVGFRIKSVDSAGNLVADTSIVGWILIERWNT